jgi:hypothetical protein
VSATLYDTWAVGISGTYDGLSSLSTVAGDVGGRGTTTPYGVVTSLNYVNGPWVSGGYYQHATADSLDTDLLVANRAATSFPATHHDSVDIGEVGLSYLVDQNHDLLGMRHHTDIKLFASAYFYRFHSRTPLEAEPDRHGTVFLVGARFSFY